MRKKIEAIAVCDNPLIKKYCVEDEVRELEAEFEEVDAERKMFAAQYEKAISDYSDVKNQLKIQSDALNDCYEVEMDMAKVRRIIDEALQQIKEGE